MFTHVFFAFEFLILQGMTEMFSLCPMAKRFETKREQLDNPVFETSNFKMMPKGQPKNKWKCQVYRSINQNYLSFLNIYSFN